jgi:hypothetical protein
MFGGGRSDIQRRELGTPGGEACSPHITRLGASTICTRVQVKANLITGNVSRESQSAWSQNTNSHERIIQARTVD